MNTAVLKTHQVVAPAVEMAVGFPATRQGKQEELGLSFLYKQRAKTLMITVITLFVLSD